MPTYKYQCEPCESIFTKVAAISEESKTPKCIKCGNDMDRIFSAPSLTFKGSGWGSDR
jgi:putative FmdB family regulatory protein